MDLFSAVMLIFSFIFLRFMLFLIDETDRMDIEIKRKNRLKGPTAEDIRQGIKDADDRGLWG